MNQLPLEFRSFGEIYWFQSTTSPKLGRSILWLYKITECSENHNFPEALWSWHIHLPGQRPVYMCECSENLSLTTSIVSIILIFFYKKQKSLSILYDFKQLLITMALQFISVFLIALSEVCHSIDILVLLVLVIMHKKCHC